MELLSGLTPPRNGDLVLRSTISRLMASFLMVPALAALTSSPAQAAPVDALSMEWQTVSYRGPTALRGVVTLRTTSRSTVKIDALLLSQS